MFEEHNPVILEVLAGRFREIGNQREAIADRSAQSGKSIADLAIDEGMLTREALLDVIAEYLGYPVVHFIPEGLSDRARQWVSGDIARMYGVIPLEEKSNCLRLLAVDPFNHGIVDDLTFSLNKDIEILIADPEEVERRIIQIYGERDTSFDSLLGEIDEDSFEESEVDDLSNSALTSLANEAPIVRFVNLILQQAVKDKVSDIHFEPYEDQFRIRYRIDGTLYEMAPPPRNLAVPVISRIKVLANLNIAERRVPQDGRIKMTLVGRAVDLRVSTLPTQSGESVVLRVLDKEMVNLDLDNLSMPAGILEAVRETVARPNGIFIVTGPTGSGKTTTLYSALREVNRVEAKILTAEDPVEYEIEGILQVAVNHQVGLDFAKALRSFLRQDPDIIMVGEIRDLETAQIAVQASLTGHVVLSTLHTNDAPGAVTRLIDMGLEPFLISASLEAVLAQRLVRRIDPDHRESYLPDDELLSRLGLDRSLLEGKSFFYGKPVSENNYTGFRGRIGLFEMLKVSDSLRELINQRSPTMRLRRKALEEGMRTLREDGIRAVLDGLTTVEEVLRYT